MTIRISLSLKKAVDSVPIIAPTVFKMPPKIARLRCGENRATDYHRYFWDRLKNKDTELEKGLNDLTEKAVKAGSLELYCECDELASCHGNTIREYLVWSLNRRGFQVKT